MKSSIIKTAAVILSVVMLLSCLTGCGDEKQTSSDGGFKVSFSKPIYRDKTHEAEVQEVFDRWQSLSSVPIEWDFLSSTDPAETLKLRFSGGDYPEVIMGNFLQTSDISRYAANGILIPLDEYINETDTPNIYKLFEEYPKTKAANYLPDGHMYSLPQFIELEAQYLENVLFINKVWLDKLGLEVPKTIDELTDVLRAFKTGDPNGNGQQDEIGMTFLDKSGYNYPEALLSCWGVQTKSGTYDSYCTVQNGEVKFAPMMDEWKEMIKFYRTLYSEGLLDIEAFTHNQDTFLAKLGADTSKIGVVWSQTNPMKNADEYIAIPPLTVGDIKPVWHIHPGIIGNRNLFSITKACKNPAAVMKWIDKFYDFEQSVKNTYGDKAVNYKDGKFTWNTPPEGKSLSTYITESKVLSGYPCAIRSSDFGTRLELNDIMKNQVENFELYREFIDTEPWPRPYYSVEEANRINELTTDIFNLVDEKKAKWIVGTEDIDKGWEQYKNDLKKMGIDELMKINQTAYNRYIDNVR